MSLGDGGLTKGRRETNTLCHLPHDTDLQLPVYVPKGYVMLESHRDYNMKKISVHHIRVHK